MMARTPRIAIFRDTILPFSETFIPQQADALERYDPFYTGGEWISNTMVPRSKAIVMYHGIGAHLRRGIRRRLGNVPARYQREISRRCPALVHAHFGPDGVTALVLARKLQVPLIVTFHGYDATIYDSALARGSYSHRYFLRKRRELRDGAALFIAVSEFIRRKLIEQGVQAHQIVQHYIGVDTGVYRPTLCARGSSIVFVGRFVEKKGAHFLIEAVRRIRGQVPAMKVTLIGDGPERPRLERLAREVPEISFAGRRNPLEIRELLSKARVFCGPSVVAANGDAEGLGLVFAEAQAMGVPVAAFDSGGVPEVVQHESTGLLAREGDVEALAGNLYRLLSMPAEQWQGFSDRAVAWIRLNFDLRTQTRKLESIYDRVLSSSSKTFTAVRTCVPTQLNHYK